MRRWTWLVAIALAACSSSNPTPDTSPTPPARVVLIGDSVMGEVAAAFEAATAGLVQVDFVLTIGAANVKDDWWDVWPKVIADHRPEAVAVMVGPWEIDRPDLGTMAWRAWYDARLDEWIDLLTADGADLVWLDALPVRDPTWQARVDHVQRAYRDLATRHRDITIVDTGAAVAGDTSRYLEHDEAGTRLRRTDGLHLCPDGAIKIARALAEVMRVPIGDRWEHGSWRDHEPAYSPEECPAS